MVVQRPFPGIPVALKRHSGEGEAAPILPDEVEEVEIRFPHTQVILEPGVEVSGLAVKYKVLGKSCPLINLNA
jgi:hypothetical protein